jgi:hypothetical protein
MVRRSRQCAVPLSLLLLVASCSISDGANVVEGSGIAAAEERAAGEFSAIRFALPGVLVVEQGEPAGIVIEADDNLLEHVDTEVRQGTLRIGSGSRRLRPSTPLRVLVRTTGLESIESAGTGAVEAPGLRAGDFSLSLAGSGDAFLPDMQVEELRVRVAGSGSVELSGSAAHQVLSLAGSGEVEARDLRSESVEASIAGSGSAWVNVSERLTANLVGSGSVNYFGDPEVTSRTVGSGRVVRAEP